MGIVVTAIVFVFDLSFKKKKILQNMLLLCASVLFLYMNLSSPGTAVRYGAINSTVEGYGVVETIVAATFKGIESVGSWLGLKDIVMALVRLPILTVGVLYMRENYSFQFK